MSSLNGPGRGRAVVLIRLGKVRLDMDLLG